MKLKEAIEKNLCEVYIYEVNKDDELTLDLDVHIHAENDDWEDILNFAYLNIDDKKSIIRFISMGDEIDVDDLISCIYENKTILEIMEEYYNIIKIDDKNIVVYEFCNR